MDSSKFNAAKEKKYKKELFKSKESEDSFELAAIKGFDFRQFINPDNVGKILAQSEISLINFMRERAKKSRIGKDFEDNTKESFKMLIGWLQWKYGETWMDYIPLICFGSNQLTLVIEAVTKP